MTSRSQARARALEELAIAAGAEPPDAGAKLPFPGVARPATASDAFAQLLAEVAALPPARSSPSLAAAAGADSIERSMQRIEDTMVGVVWPPPPSKAETYANDYQLDAADFVRPSRMGRAPLVRPVPGAAAALSAAAAAAASGSIAASSSPALPAPSLATQSQRDKEEAAIIASLHKSNAAPLRALLTELAALRGHGARLAHERELRRHLQRQLGVPIVSPPVSPRAAAASMAMLLAQSQQSSGSRKPHARVDTVPSGPNSPTHGGGSGFGMGAPVPEEMLDHDTDAPTLLPPPTSTAATATSPSTAKPTGLALLKVKAKAKAMEAASQQQQQKQPSPGTLGRTLGVSVSEPEEKVHPYALTTGLGGLHAARLELHARAKSVGVGLSSQQQQQEDSPNHWPQQHMGRARTRADSMLDLPAAAAGLSPSRSASANAMRSSGGSGAGAAPPVGRWGQSLPRSRTRGRVLKKKPGVAGVAPIASGPYRSRFDVDPDPGSMEMPPATAAAVAGEVEEEEGLDGDTAVEVPNAAALRSPVLIAQSTPSSYTVVRSPAPAAVAAGGDVAEVASHPPAALLATLRKKKSRRSLGWGSPEPTMAAGDAGEDPAPLSIGRGVGAELPLIAESGAYSSATLSHASSLPQLPRGKQGTQQSSMESSSPSSSAVVAAARMGTSTAATKSPVHLSGSGIALLPGAQRMGLNVGPGAAAATAAGHQTPSAGTAARLSKHFSPSSRQQLHVHADPQHRASSSYGTGNGTNQPLQAMPHTSAGISTQATRRLPTG